MSKGVSPNNTRGGDHRIAHLKRGSEWGPGNGSDGVMNACVRMHHRAHAGGRERGLLDVVVSRKSLRASW